MQNEGSRESLDRFDGMAELVSGVHGATIPGWGEVECCKRGPWCELQALDSYQVAFNS